MSPADALRFAWQALTRHRLRTALSLLGVTIGVSAILLLTAVGEGARRYVRGQFASLGSNLIFVVPGKTETSGSLPGLGAAPNDLTLGDAKALERRLARARLVVPVSMGSESVSYRERSRQVPIIGSTPGLLEARNLAVATGRFLPPGDIERGAPVCVLGPGLARELFPAEAPVGRIVRIGDWRFRVVGVLERRGVQLGFDMDDIAIVPVASGMKMFDRNSLFRIIIKAASPSAIDGVCRRVTAVLRERHREDDVTCLTQDAVVAGLGSILGVLTLVLAGIAAVSLTVAAVGVMNVMLVSVAERAAEIGLLMAVGAGRRQILSLFLLEAVILSAAGGLAGLLLSLAITTAAGHVWTDFDLTIPGWAVAAALLTSALVGAAAGVRPAARAARLDPIQALQGA